MIKLIPHAKLNVVMLEVQGVREELIKNRTILENLY